MLSRKNFYHKTLFYNRFFITVLSGFLVEDENHYLDKKVASSLVQEEECDFGGYKLCGKIQFVESFANIKVKVVESFPDLKVKIVDSFPDKCGEWQIVDSFPDLKVQIVESFAELKIKFVESFPGLP